MHKIVDQLVDALLDHGATRVQRREMPPPDDLVDHYRALLPLR